MKSNHFLILNSSRNKLILFSSLSMVAMKHSSFYRLIRPMLSSTFVSGKDGGILKQYHSYNCGLLDEKPYSLIRPSSLPLRPLCELSDLSAPRSTRYEILGPGMILLRQYVTLKEQVDIVNICQKWGMEPGGFYMPSCQNGDERYHMCFGRRNWDPATRYNNPYRSDGSEPPPIPYELTSLAQTALQAAQDHLGDELMMMMNFLQCALILVPSVSMESLGHLAFIRLDIDESSNALERGLPVVSISIGEWGEFLYGHTKNKLKGVVLESGDVLIFGGRSRLIYHGVTEISQYCSPRPLIEASGLKIGRLNLTLRQF
ncbi:putative DNA oxidative demethylase [Helianthus anomalus]